MSKVPVQNTLQTVKMQDKELICICGNTQGQAGFYPCNEIGSEVDPTPQGWKRNLYTCDTCGRIIDDKTLQVQGFRQANYTYLK